MAQAIKKPLPDWSAGRILKIKEINNAQSYLEIGNETGKATLYAEDISKSAQMTFTNETCSYPGR
jgi:hypothetical protein